MTPRPRASRKQFADPTSPPAEKAPPLANVSVGDPPDVFLQARALEMARTHWQYGAWEQLAGLSAESVHQNPDRAKLAALVAGAQASLGQRDTARISASQAREWGCDRQILARVLISAVHNSLATAALGLNETDTARRHFREAIDLLEFRADGNLLARTREIRQAARAGLLPDAVTALDDTLKQVQARPEEVNASLGMLREELNILQHELVLSMKRNQIYPVSGEEKSSGDLTNLETRAVSQLGQDLWVLEQTGYKRGGFFVDFGATDGISLNNTWLLESEFGWTGLCAEPNPDFFGKLQANRACTVSDACIGIRTGDKVDFLLADVYGCIAEYADRDKHTEKRAVYRTAGQVVRLRTISLEDFLLQHGAPREIDYLSIDTEGSEYDILSAFSFDRWRIRLITVEHNFTPMREKIYALLSAQGYIRTEAQFDDWYALPG